MTCLGDIPELINEIIQYFQNDFSTLHSCILVNRKWCRFAIPLLWEDPFSIKFPKKYHFIHFIEIYLHNLNEEDKMKLKKYGINDDLFPSNTSFNYSNFIKCLNTQIISITIEIWLKNAMSSNYSPELVCFVYSSLIKIFIENEVNLHTFEVEAVRLFGEIDNDCLESTFQLILQNPNFICNIKNLTINNSHRLNTSILLSFLNFIYFNCKSVSSVYIDNLYMNEHFEKVINPQRNLKKICYKSHLYSLESLKNPNCSNTLKTLIFYQIDLMSLKVNFNEVFEQLKVLESVHILYCELDSVIVQQIINLTRPFKLKSLFINYISQINLKLLLQKAGNYLENIEFRNYEYELQFFELIKIYCNKIKFLSLIDVRDIFPAFYLIKNIQQNQNLSYIILYFIDYCNDEKLGSIILQNLGQILPYRLEYLCLVFKINENDLEVFFKNSQNIFIKKLLIRNKFYKQGDNIIPCIKKYVMKEKRVTYLAFENYKSTGERSHLSDYKIAVEEFKSYGIKVKNYDDLSIKTQDYVIKLD
jgi:hypothetical protein